MDTKVLKLNSPIVLAHGLLGFSQIRVFKTKSVSYFREIPEFLEREGNRVIRTDVPPTRSVVSRGHALKESILKQLGDEPFHLIAHSMGGLDARYMITHLGMDKQTITLTTIGTPHRGTVIADRLVDRGERLGLANLMKYLQVPVEAFYDLRSSVCADFNIQTPNSPNVRYFSVIGIKQRKDMLFALRFTSDILAKDEGPNDGLVSSYSARWGEWETIWDCDHASQIGWVGTREKSPALSFSVQEGYQEILQQLIKLGF